MHLPGNVPCPCLAILSFLNIWPTIHAVLTRWTRDGGLPFSRLLAHVHPKLEMPLNALILTFVLVIIFGCIFLGSSSAFNAIISASVVALGLSYAIPPAINCARGRKMLPATRPFVLPGLFGWFANLLGIAYVIVTTVLFVFPPELPVTGRYVYFHLVASN